MSDYIVVDDFIPVSLQNEIKHFLLESQNFPWYFNPDLTYGKDGDESKRTPGNAHVFRNECVTNSPSWNVVSPLAHIAAEKFGRPYVDVLTCRTFLQFPLNVDLETTSLHVDLPVPHWVLLYYVNDSDAETILVNKTYEIGTEMEFGCAVEDYDILLSVKPKQGRALMFDGKYFHAHQIVKSGVRCAINFNML